LTERLVNYKGDVLKLSFLIFLFFLSSLYYPQNATEIVQRANDLLLGKTSQGTNTMTLIRPDWTREVSMKVWSKGIDYYMILITAPAREKGQVFMKRDKEMWNWIPSINKMIKLPPSMMSQSWMGSDFTNDDLLKESSIVVDYNHKIIGHEFINEDDCYKIEMIPKPEAAVVWGKIITWIAKDKYYQLKSEFYDEIGTLISVQYADEIEALHDRVLPTRLTIIPKDKDGNKTVLKLENMIFNKDIPISFFSQQNMKRVR
jgi:outer membrane lipoprotein-sorting protein